MKNVITIEVVIDPDWVGSVSPYRVKNPVTDNYYSPMTKDEVEEQVSTMVYRALWDD